MVEGGVSMQHQEKPMLFDDIKPGMWVIVIYEEEKFLAKVQHESTDAPTQLTHLKALRSQVLMQKKSTG